MAGLTFEVERANRAPVLFSSLTLDLDITYVLVLALLLLPLLILNGLVFGPFMKLFEERHEKLEGALVRANEKLDLAEEKAKQFQEKMKDASAKGTDVRNKIRAETQAQINARLETEKKKVAAELEKAVAEVRATRQAALAQVDVDARKMAEATASKLLGRAV